MYSAQNNRMRALGIGLSVAAACLFAGGDVAHAGVKHLGAVNARVYVPHGWKKTEVVAGKKVSFKMPKGGKFSVTYKPRKLPLGAVAAAVKKSGRAGGWRLLEEKRNIRQFGKRAHLLVYEVPTSKRRVKVRAAFFFVNTPNGYYTLYFGTKRKHFRNGLYKAVYSTFNAL